MAIDIRTTIVAAICLVGGFATAKKDAVIIRSKIERIIVGNQSGRIFEA